MLKTFIKNECAAWQYALISIRENKTYFEKIVWFLTIAVLCTLSVHTLFDLYNIHVWRHDALLYFDSYGLKLKTEGRWLNFLSFNILKLIPPYLSILLSFCSFFYFIYICAVNIIQKKNAVLFSLCTLQISPIYSLAGWPLTPLPSYLLLAASAFFYKKLDFRLFFLIFGILFQGAFNNFYNLLPLLFLGKIYRNPKKLLPLFFYYVLGFLLGFLFAELAVLLASGSLIKVADWRHPQPVHNFSDLFHNIEGSFYNFLAHMRIFGSLPLAICLASVVVVLCIENGKMRIVPFLLLAAIVFSTYFQVIPLGIGVDLRTSFPLYLGFLFTIIFLYKKFFFIACFACSIVAFCFFSKNTNYLQYHNIITSTYYDYLIKTDTDPKLHKIIFLPSSSDMKYVENKIASINKCKNEISESFCDPYRWASIAYAAGFKTVITDQDKDEFVHFKKSYPKDNFQNNALYSFTKIDNCLIITFNPEFSEKIL